MRSWHVGKYVGLLVVAAGSVLVDSLLDSLLKTVLLLFLLLNEEQL
ncbi:hypothetical protein Hanom_Chr11g00988121 [Helianthus anomalus]